MKKDNKKKNNKTGRVIKHLKSDRRILIKSLLWAIALFLVSYFLHNLPWSWGGPNVGQRIEQVRQIARGESIPSDLFLINVAYDRALVDVNDEFGLSKGNIDITDRKKLSELLRQLKNSDYKYIILDVILTDEYHTNEDSTLFGLISSMDNIVIAKSETTRLADDRLDGKARYSDYSTNILESDFVKYEFIRNGEPTLPYQVYLDLNGDRITNWCGLYFFKGRLANKSVILRYPVRLWNTLNIDNDAEDHAQVQYYNLGSDLLDIGTDIPSKAKDKIVVIGDFSENDMHDTYLGKIAGPVINLNAYYALVNDNLTMPYGEIVFIILLYTLIWYLIFKRKSVISAVPYFRKKHSDLFNLIISFVSVGVLLMAISGLMYIIFGLDMRIFIASVVFAAYDNWLKYKEQKSEKQKTKVI